MRKVDIVHLFIIAVLSFAVGCAVASHIKLQKRVAAVEAEQKRLDELDSRIVGWVSFDLETGAIIYTPKEKR